MPIGSNNRLSKDALIQRGVSEEVQQQTLMMFRMAPEFQRVEMIKSGWCGGG